MDDFKPRKLGTDEASLNAVHDTKTGELYEVSEGYYNEMLESKHISEDKEIELRLARELLNSNLRRLTKRQRDVLYYTMARLTQEEIAVKLNISKSAVTHHLALARKKLARIITNTKRIIKGE